MEKQSYGIDRVSKTRRIPHRTTKKLERSYEVNRNNIENYKETIQQEVKELLRTMGWRQYMAREQKYSLKQTFKEAGPKKIQTF